MTPSDPAWYATGKAHLWPPYSQGRNATPPWPVVGTDGIHIELADGRRLIDGIASWWTACHGYNHPHIRAAIRTQLDVMPHVMFAGLIHEPAARLAARLTALMPGDLGHVFFVEGGSVAVEVAMKMAIQYWINQGTRRRHKILAFRHGYHGDTFAAMSVCDPEEGMHSLFKGVLAEQIIADLPTDAAGEAALDQILARRNDEIAAMIVEPLVQGAGGMKMHEPEVLATLRRLADKHGILLIFDEIFTGFGRTGTMFACEAANVVPDIMTISKALTGGTLPLAAAVARDHVHRAFISDDPGAALMHGPTYMANPLACAAANASLDLFEKEPRLEAVARLEAGLREGLMPCRDIPGVVDVRVKGAIGAVQLTDLKDINWLKNRFVEEGVWVRPLGDVVYLTPAFVMPPEAVATLTDAIERVLGEASRR